jgi:hypothetical protein
MRIGVPFKRQATGLETPQGSNFFTSVNQLPRVWFRQAGKARFARKGGTNFRMMHFKFGIKNRKDYIP